MTRGRRQALDDLFPTLVRYVGLGVMVYETLVDKVERPHLIVAATGMILFKTVLSGGRTDGEDPSSKEERWSHLP